MGLFLTSIVWAQTDDYQIHPGDGISISVYGEPDLSFSSILVPNDGKFTYPFIGEVVAAGKTERQLEKDIADKLRDGFLLDPQVTVGISAYRPIYIGGAVHRIGRQPFEVNMDIEKLLAVAGGLAQYGNVDDIIEGLDLV